MLGVEDTQLITPIKEKLEINCNSTEAVKELIRGNTFYVSVLILANEFYLLIFLVKIEKLVYCWKLCQESSRQTYKKHQIVYISNCYLIWLLKVKLKNYFVIFITFFQSTYICQILQPFCGYNSLSLSVNRQYGLRQIKKSVLGSLHRNSFSNASTLLDLSLAIASRQIYNFINGKYF